MFFGMKMGNNKSLTLKSVSHLWLYMNDHPMQHPESGFIEHFKSLIVTSWLLARSQAQSLS